MNYSEKETILDQMASKKVKYLVEYSIFIAIVCDIVSYCCIENPGKFKDVY